MNDPHVFTSFQHVRQGGIKRIEPPGTPTSLGDKKGAELDVLHLRKCET
jgi:hypothetical protein